MNRRDFARGVLGATAGSVLGHIGSSSGSALVSPASIGLSVMLWTILPHEAFDRRLAIVAEAGYRSIELVDEYEHWTSVDFARFAKRREELGLKVDAIALTEPGVANPGTASVFRQALDRRLATAAALDCKDIIVLSGDRIPDIPHATQFKAAVDALKFGGELAGKRGCRLLLESLDPEEEPRCFLNSVVEGFEIVRAVANPNVRMLYDFYHEQIASGNLLKKLTNNIDLVGLVHVADVPGRHEPGTGEINYGTILRRLADLKYSGIVAMEFLPLHEPVAALRAAREFAEASLLASTAAGK